MTISRISVSVPCALAILATGCISGVRGGEVVTGQEEGLRYFLAAPYLLVTQTGDGQWDARLELGVDRSREFALVPYNYLAMNHAVVEFNPDGTLKSFTLTEHSDDVPVAVIEALREVGIQASKLKQDEIQAERSQGASQQAKASAALTKEAEATPEGRVERQAYVFRIDGGRAASDTSFASMFFVPPKENENARTGEDTIEIACLDAPKKPRPCTTDDPGKLDLWDTENNKLEGQALEKARGSFTLPEGKDKLVVSSKKLQGISRVLLGTVEIWTPKP